MVRTKNLPVQGDQLPPIDYTARYSSPFILSTDWEASIYVKLTQNEVTRPHYLDWDLIRDLKVELKVTRYLKTLGLETFARNVDYSGYDNLCYEFLTSMVVSGDKKNPKITVRMENKKYVITLARMKSVFGFSTGEPRARPRGYNANVDWEALTGFQNWDSLGMPAGYITDPALSIVHKFLAYNVSGKEQANKVNTSEVYLLTCAKNGTKVCASGFIWNAMAQMQIRPTAHASFGPIITGLTHNFKIMPVTKGPQDGYEELELFFIDFGELKGAQLISDRHTILPPAKRQCVTNFINIEIAAGRLPLVLPDFEAGPSNAANEEEDGEDEPMTPEEQPPGIMSGDGYQQFQNDFQSFRDHFDSSFTTFRQDVQSQFTTFRHDVQSRFDAQDQQFATFSQDVYSRFDSQNQQIASLQSQWDAWNAFHPPQPPQYVIFL